jgi:hypothetical protein
MTTCICINRVTRTLGLPVALAAVVVALVAPGAQALSCPQSVAQVKEMKDCAPAALATATTGAVRVHRRFGVPIATSEPAIATPIAAEERFDWADAGIGAGISSGAFLLALTGVIVLHRRRTVHRHLA